VGISRLLEGGDALERGRGRRRARRDRRRGHPQCGDAGAQVVEQTRAVVEKAFASGRSLDRLLQAGRSRRDRAAMNGLRDGRKRAERDVEVGEERRLLLGHRRHEGQTDSIRAR